MRTETTNAKHKLSASDARIVVSTDCARKLEMITGRPNATALYAKDDAIAITVASTVRRR